MSIKKPTQHHLWRSLTGPKRQAPLPSTKPQYLTGPRYGQQLALVRAAGGDVMPAQLPAVRS